MEFTEKLIIAHFITNLIDPYRNNLATRNPKSLDEVERLVKNDLQYLKPDIHIKAPVNDNNHYTFKMNPNKNFGQFNQIKILVTILVILMATIIIILIVIPK